jgi:alpha-L-fucosidase
MKRHNRSIYGCGAAPKEFKAPQDCRYTYNAETKRLYLHLFAWPFREIHLPDLADKVSYAQLLNDASEIKLKDYSAEVHANLKGRSPAGSLTLELPVKAPNVTVPVIELMLK